MDLTAFVRKIDKFERVGVDSMFFIYLFEEHPRYLSFVKPLFEKAEKQKITIISSVLTILEVLTGYKAANDLSSEYRFKQMLKDYREGIKISNIDFQIVETAANLRAKYHFRSPDAIHLATAIGNKAQIFITNDRRLKQIKEIKVICLRDYLN